MCQERTVIGFFWVICLPLAQSQSPGGEMLQLASLDPVPTLVVHLNDNSLRITELGRAPVPKEGMQAWQKVTHVSYNFWTLISSPIK